MFSISYILLLLLLLLLVGISVLNTNLNLYFVDFLDIAGYVCKRHVQHNPPEIIQSYETWAKNYNDSLKITMTLVRC